MLVPCAWSCTSWTFEVPTFLLSCDSIFSALVVQHSSLQEKGFLHLPLDKPIYPAHLRDFGDTLWEGKTRSILFPRDSFWYWLGDMADAFSSLRGVTVALWLLYSFKSSLLQGRGKYKPKGLFSQTKDYDTKKQGTVLCLRVLEASKWTQTPMNSI